jgi:hypothetical protein
MANGAPSPGRALVRRNPARPGQSYRQANPQLVAVGNDVLDIKRRIETTWPMLEVILDVENEEWCIIEHCPDTDRLCFAIPCSEGLDERVIERIHRADGEVQAREGVDLADVLEKQQDEVWRRKEREMADQLGESHERLLYALRKDGVDAGIPKVFLGERRVHKNRT